MEPEPSYVLLGSDGPISSMHFGTVNLIECLISGTQLGFILLWNLNIKRFVFKKQISKNNSVLQVFLHENLCLAQSRDGYLHLWKISDIFYFENIGLIECCANTFCPFDVGFRNRDDLFVFVPSVDDPSSCSVVAILKKESIFSLMDKDKKPGMIMSIKSNRSNKVSSDSFIFIGYESGAIYSWDFDRPSQPLHVFEGHKETVTCLDFCWEKGVGISGTADGKIFLWTFSNRRKINKVTSNEECIDVSRTEINQLNLKETALMSPEFSTPIDPKLDLKETTLMSQKYNNPENNASKIEFEKVEKLSEINNDIRDGVDQENVAQINRIDPQLDLKETTLIPHQFSTPRIDVQINAIDPQLDLKETTLIPPRFNLLKTRDLEIGVSALSLRHDAKIIAGGMWDGSMRVFTGKKLRPLMNVDLCGDFKDDGRVGGGGVAVNCVQFENGVLFAGGADGCISSWRVYMDTLKSDVFSL